MNKASSRAIVRRLAIDALLAAFAAALGYLDAVLPVFDFLPVPGLKLGLANFAVLEALLLYGPADAFMISGVRVLIVNLLLFPSPTALLFSACGGAFSLAVMSVLRALRFHPVTQSVSGGICHNLGQTVAAVLLLSTPKIFSYLLILLPAGALTGALIGLLCAAVHPRIAGILSFKTKK